MKIIHCLFDDKFTDGTIRLYQSDDRHINKYVIVTKKKEIPSIQYIKYKDVTILTVESFLQMAKEYDVVILHSLKCLPIYCIHRIPSSCKVVWYAWGFDLYYGINPIIKLNLYQKYTKRFTLFERQLDKLLQIPSCLINFEFGRQALERINYFSGVFPYEYDLLKKNHPFISAKKLDYYYGDIDFFIKNEVDTSILSDRHNVIIGNSGDPSNNHYEALLALKQYHFEPETKIILPFNYGGSKKYKEWVLGLANKLYPNQVYVLDRFLPLDEYINLVSRCKVAIFNHERQQASDNIFMQLLYGAKVYLSETSGTYIYLKELGFKVFPLQQGMGGDNFDYSPEDILYNRRLLTKLYSESTILNRVKLINNIIESELQTIS